MVEKRKRMHQDFLKGKPAKDKHFLKTVIPYTAVVEKMGLYREPVPRYKPRSMAALAYSELWKELKKRISSV
jgi:cellulose biosynthesis protein BcsQ